MTAGADGRVRQLQAYGAYHALAAGQRAEREQAAQQRVNDLITEVVAVLAQALGAAKGEKCRCCGLALATRLRTCPRCGTTAARGDAEAAARAWLREHPLSTAREIGDAVGADGRVVRGWIRAWRLSGTVSESRIDGCSPLLYAARAARRDRPRQRRHTTGQRHLSAVPASPLNHTTKQETNRHASR